MKLYLMRHAEALSAEINPECPLSDRGKAQAQKIANFLAPQGILVSHVFHSGKLRAQQTAEIVATAIASKRLISVLPGITPNDQVSPILTEINEWTESALIVSHLPFLPRLLSALILHHENEMLVDFQCATLICLTQISPKKWYMNWALPADLLPSL